MKINKDYDRIFIERHYSEKIRPLAFDLLSKGYIREYTVNVVRSPSRLYRYKVDFAHPRKKHIVEIDGPSHSYKQRKDSIRDRHLENDGWTVQRVKHRFVRPVFQRQFFPGFETEFDAYSIDPK